MAALTLLSTRGLSRAFGGLHAVEAVDFDLPAGEVRAVIGPNGAGKTTFVGLVCGRVAPSAGRIVFDGEDITRLPAHRRVGRGIAYTFQITSVFGRLSAFDNVALNPKLLILDEPTQGLSDSEIESFCNLIRTIATEATVLLIEHNMDVVMQLAHRITVMNQGRILAEGTPDEIRSNEAVQQVYLGA